MEEKIYYTALYDIYGNLLTEKEQNCFTEYFEEDLSFGEIAENYEVSKNAIYKTVQTVLDKLTKYENALHIYEKEGQLKRICTLPTREEMIKEIERLLEKEH